MVVVNDRSMTNVHVLDDGYAYLDNKFLHALVSLRMVCKQIIAHDSDFDWRQLKGFQT